jgi:hypothetical protein
MRSIRVLSGPVGRADLRRNGLHFSAESHDHIHPRPLRYNVQLFGCLFNVICSQFLEKLSILKVHMETALNYTLPAMGRIRGECRRCGESLEPVMCNVLFACCNWSISP